MTYRIGGQVVDQGSGVADQPVFVVDTGDADPSNWTVEAATTTAADGSWSVVVPSGKVERYHAVTQVDDSGTLKNSESKPYLTAHPELRPARVDIQFNVPEPQTIGQAIPDSVETWEDGDLVNWTQSGSGWGNNTNNPVLIGDNSAKAGTGQLYSTAGLPDYPQKGEVFRYYAISTGTDGEPTALWGLSDASNFYQCQIRPDKGDIQLGKKTGGAFTSLQTASATLSNNIWYALVVEWHDGSGSEADNTLVCTLHSVNADGSLDSELVSVQAQDSEHASATGVGLEGTLSDSSAFDNIGVEGSV